MLVWHSCQIYIIILNKDIIIIIITFLIKFTPYNWYVIMWQFSYQLK